MRILIIEDEKKIADSIKKGLDQESYAVDVAYDGAHGCDLAVIENYDVIILDLMLPKMNGMDICRYIRGEDINTPILMLTAKSQLEDKVNGLNAGADDYLVKPFAFEELLARIKALTRRPETNLGTELTVDDLTFNTLIFEVRRDGKEIDLSKKEFALLEYLLRNKGQILSKEQIINSVWSYESDVLPNTVEVYIGYLRNKIEKPFANKKPLIETIRGFGYRIGGDK